jgi:hypothetical protein
MWKHFYNEAVEEKAWAERVSKDTEWLVGASDWSKESMARSLKLSVVEIAANSLRYVHMRANMGYGYKNQTPIAPDARALWLKLGGTVVERT